MSVFRLDPDKERREYAAKHPRKLNLRAARPKLPDELALPKLRQGLAELDGLRQKGNESARAKQEAQAGLVQAEMADRDAFAAAIRAGRKDPGTPATDAARAKLAEAERLTAATGQAQAAAILDVTRLIEADRADFVAEVDAQAKVALSAATQALAEYEAAQERLYELNGFRDWLMVRKSAPDGAAANALQVLHRSLDRANAAEQDSADG